MLDLDSGADRLLGIASFRSGSASFGRWRVFVGADRPPRAVVIDTSLFWRHHSSDPRTLRDLELKAFVGVYRLWRFMLALHYLPH